MDKQQWIRHLMIVNAIYYRSDSGIYLNGYNINNARQSSKGKHTSSFYNLWHKCIHISSVRCWKKPERMRCVFTSILSIKSWKLFRETKLCFFLVGCILAFRPTHWTLRSYFLLNFHSTIRRVCRLLSWALVTWNSLVGLVVIIGVGRFGFSECHQWLPLLKFLLFIVN